MINFKFGNEPSNQTEFTGLGQPGDEMMAKAREWVDKHADDFERYLRIARFQVRFSPDGKASSNACKEWLRTGLDVSPTLSKSLSYAPRNHVSVPNAYAPALARIAMERDKTLDFRLAASKVDGYTEVVF